VAGDDAAVRTLASTIFVAAAALAAPPEPEAYFGHRMGANRSVLDWHKVTGYFAELDKESDRVLVREFGKSTEGRPMIVAYISSAENLRRLEPLRQIQKRLADPRVTPEAELEKLAAAGKTIVLITCTIHSTEIASTHTAVEFAWRLATSETAKTRQILENVVVLLAPSINPDGLDLVTKWYRSKLGTAHEGTSPPELYQKYVGHDNNRDWYIFSQAETRAVVGQLHNQWHPQIVYDVHQMGGGGARMFVPPWMDPIEPNVDPVIAQQANMIGMIMASDLTAAGRKGVVVNSVYDFWTPGRHYQSYHGGMRILSESASVRIATPVTVKPDQINTTAQGYNPREKSWNYLEPFLGGDWKLRDLVDDQLIAMESVCLTAAQRREDLLRNFYFINKRASERRAPYAFVLPLAQRDPGAARRLAETLEFGAVEIERAAEAFTADGRSYPGGSYVVRMQQPFSSFAKTLLERQKYPESRLYPGGPPKRPYDVTAHTLPLLLGVEAVAVNDQFQANLARAREFRFSYDGTLAAGALAASDTESWKRVNAAWKAGQRVSRDAKTGDFFVGTRPAGSVELQRPRIGIYKSWMPNMDEGWTRWIVEQMGFEYTSVRNPEILKGGLRERFDVIVFAEQNPGAISQGYRPGAMPAEYTGGLGTQGEAELKKFAEAGGRLIFFNDASLFAVGHLGVKAKNVLSGVSSREFYCPGSLLKVRLEGSGPLTYGMPREFSVWMEQSPVWESEDPGVKPVARYLDSGVLDSGWLWGEQLIAGKPAVVEAAMGAGKAVLFGMRPQYRAQSYLTLKMFLNALVQ
jgi:hypothetical protein